jgi:tetraspanin-5
VIYDKGCLRAGEEWVERNLIPVAAVAVAMAVLQVWQKEQGAKCVCPFVLSFSFHFVHFIFCFFPNIQIGDLSSVINEKGCVQAGEEWLEKNLLVVAGVAVGIAFLQVRTRKKIPWGHILWGELIF